MKNTPHLAVCPEYYHNILYLSRPKPPQSWGLGKTWAQLPKAVSCMREFVLSDINRLWDTGSLLLGMAAVVISHILLAPRGGMVWPKRPGGLTGQAGWPVAALIEFEMYGETTFLPNIKLKVRLDPHTVEYLQKLIWHLD